MSDLDFTISCTVTFFSKKMTNPPNLINGKYSSHIVVKGTKEPIELTLLMVRMFTLISQYKLMLCQ